VDHPPDHAFTLRHPAEADQPRIAAVVDGWFPGQHVNRLAARSWFRHFATTSWIAEDATGAPIGFVLGYRSQDVRAEAVVHLVGVHPSHRRHGIGRTLVNALLIEVADAGATTVIAVAWPGEPIAVAFFRALGFTPDDGPGTQPLYGTPAYPDYEGEGEDRVVFRRRLESPASTSSGRPVAARPPGSPAS
jgi:GNAT superfamily N-acetyltransferase